MSIKDLTPQIIKKWIKPFSDYTKLEVHIKNITKPKFLTVPNNVEIIIYTSKFIDIAHISWHEYINVSVKQQLFITIKKLNTYYIKNHYNKMN